MKKREMKDLVASLSTAKIEKLLHILEVELRERHYAQNPEEELYTISELEEMEAYSELAH